ncbi:hypothetical protein [Streptomyces sp. NPDC101776]|uniref:hypothetical protein n=1 Tax=Streptomyces sp. NPDC101776 TaxID=3366146 RepID=UPI003826B5E1
MLITAVPERLLDVGGIPTPQGPGFFDIEAVETQTSSPIRSDWRTPVSIGRFPPAGALAPTDSIRHQSSPTAGVGGHVTTLARVALDAQGPWSCLRRCRAFKA